MKFEDLLRLVGQEPVFETGLLLAGQQNPNYIRRQLSEWVKTGKLNQLRRGLYSVAKPYQKVAPHPFVIANRMVYGSYISLQAGLAYYGLIPEYVPVMTSVTTGKPGVWENPLGRFEYHHIQSGLMFGYESIEVQRGQTALVARPAKALLDLVYLQPGGDSMDYLRELRLQNVHLIDIELLQKFAKRADKPKLTRAAEAIIVLINEIQADYEML